MSYVSEDYLESLEEGLFDNIDRAKTEKLKKCDKNANYYNGQIEALDAAIKYGGDKPKDIKRAKRDLAICKKCLSKIK